MCACNTRYSTYAFDAPGNGVRDPPISALDTLNFIEFAREMRDRFFAVCMCVRACVCVWWFFFRGWKERERGRERE